MRRRARPHLAVSTLRICSRSDLPQKASVCFLNLCLIVSSCFYRHILGIYDSCALGGKGDRETGGSGAPWRPQLSFWKPWWGVRQSRASSGVGRGSRPQDFTVTGTGAHLLSSGAVTPGSCFLALRYQPRDDIKSPYGVQSLLLKSDQNQPWEEVDDKLMNTVFSFKLCWGRN